MDFLLDVHLPISLSKFLDKQTDCSSIHVNQILQRWNTTDAEICKHADKNNLVVITKDEDFKNTHFINKTPRKIIRLILGNTSNEELILLFAKYISLLLKLSESDSFYVEISNEQIIIID